jgi:peptidoglycan/LPS O-acetylase OafA/YrhL
MDPRHAHVPELQSIRGVAALTVLLHHSSFLFSTGATFHVVSETLINAHAAVMIFFVLSGYVLVRSLRNKAIDLKNCARFYTARLFRIYPALWAACALAVAYLMLVHFQVPTQPASSWYDQYFVAPPGVGDIVRNVTAINSLLVPPSWSVRTELLASAVIPVICVLSRRGLGIVLLGLLGAIAIAASLGKYHLGAIWVYLPSFVVGAVAFQYQHRLGRLFGKAWVIALATGCLILFRRVNPGWRFETDYHAIVPTFVESLAAAIIIVGVVARPVASLRNAVMIRLGDISYSLYLTHFIVMSALAKVLSEFLINQDLRALLLMAGTVAVTWPLSTFLYAYVEKPGIWAGRAFFDSVYLRARPAPTP